jgi:hypothetical protein
VRRANEKGHVERLLGTARKRFLVPVPNVDSFETLNRHLIESRRRDLDERTRGRSGTKRELLQDDSAAWLPLPQRPFEARRIETGTATTGDEYALDIGRSDSDSIRSVVEHRTDGPVRLFSLDGRPQTQGSQVPRHEDTRRVRLRGQTQRQQAAGARTREGRVSRPPGKHPARRAIRHWTGKERLFAPCGE